MILGNGVLCVIIMFFTFYLFDAGNCLNVDRKICKSIEKFVKVIDIDSYQFQVVKCTFFAYI